MEMDSLIYGALLGGVLSRKITEHYHNKAGKELSQELDKLRSEARWKDGIGYFETMLVKGTWNVHNIAGQRTWLCNEDTNLKLIEDDPTDNFKEPWTENYADKSGSRSEVHLVRNGDPIKTLIFIHLDGERIIVPMPRVLGIKDRNGNVTSVTYYWERESIEYKVCSIIGKYYIHNNIETIAKLSGIDIVYGQSRT